MNFFFVIFFLWPFFCGLFETSVAESKSDQTYKLNTQWFQKHQPSNLNKFLFNFDGWYFQNHWKLSGIMYLILKV